MDHWQQMQVNINVKGQKLLDKPNKSWKKYFDKDLLKLGLEEKAFDNKIQKSHETENERNYIKLKIMIFYKNQKMHRIQVCISLSTG